VLLVGDDAKYGLDVSVDKRCQWKGEEKLWEVQKYLFLMTSFLPAALGPRVYSGSDKNEYQKQKSNDSEE
jgi:hypothetical protein